MKKFFLFFLKKKTPKLSCVKVTILGRNSSSIGCESLNTALTSSCPLAHFFLRIGNNKKLKLVQIFSIPSTELRIASTFYKDSNTTQVSRMASKVSRISARGTNKNTKRAKFSLRSERKSLDSAVRAHSCLGFSKVFGFLICRVVWKF